MIAIASAPQKVTRHAPASTPAPPARAATAPSTARNTIDVPDTHGITDARGAAAFTASGSAAPSAKLPAEARAACSGLALNASEMPSSSRACAPSASWRISCAATCAARSGSSPCAR